MNGYTNVGMGVHARSVACKALRPETGERRSNTFSGEGYEHDLLAWLKGLPGPVRCAYESSCTGFWLSRFLGREGVEREVMAVSALPRSPKDRRRKDGRHDAGVVLREMRNPASDASYAWVPDPEIEFVERMERSAKELAKAVAAEAGKPRWKPCVDALIRLKGIDIQTAFPACAEFGDFSRFRGGRRVSRRIGCTAPEDSSGESRRQGKAAKEGGSHLRRAPVEGVSSISRQAAHRKRLRPGRAASPQVEDIALEANARLKGKRDALKGAGKRTDTAKVAVASELARWMRAMGLQVQREQAAA